MSLRTENGKTAAEAGLGYEFYTPLHVLSMASRTGKQSTVVAIVEAENETYQTFGGFYDADEAAEVAARIKRMRKMKVHEVYVLSAEGVTLV